MATSGFAYERLFHHIAGLMLGTPVHLVSTEAADFAHRCANAPNFFAAWQSRSDFPFYELDAQTRAEILDLVRFWLTYSSGNQHLVSCAGPTMPHGIWDHFKGGIYLTQGFGAWASGNGEGVVAYISMSNGKAFYRLATQWNEIVRWPDGQLRSRFIYRGPDLSTPAPTFKVGV